MIHHSSLPHSWLIIHCGSHLAVWLHQHDCCVVLPEFISRSCTSVFPNTGARSYTYDLPHEHGCIPAMKTIGLRRPSRRHLLSLHNVKHRPMALRVMSRDIMAHEIFMAHHSMSFDLMPNPGENCMYNNLASRSDYWAEHMKLTINM